MYKYGKIIALFSTIVWLAFIFSAFRGFHFWYAGFVFFFWVALASLNYRHDTSLWLLKNKPWPFARFYAYLFVLAFIIDFIIGQRLTNFWSYPFYRSFGDWVRLYAIIYPFGGLSVLEFTYFISFLFGERFQFVNKERTRAHWFIERLEFLMLLLFLVAPILASLGIIGNYKNFWFWFVILWPLVALARLRYHIRHWLHWLAIFTAALVFSVFLHEVPNAAVFEWKYGVAPVLNQEIFGVPWYVVLGWYVLVIGMFRAWLHFALKKERTDL